MKVKSESEVSQFCPALRDPMDCSLPGSSVHRIFQAEVLEWGAIAFSSLLLIIQGLGTFLFLFFKTHFDVLVFPKDTFTQWFPNLDA